MIETGNLESRKRAEEKRRAIKKYFDIRPTAFSIRPVDSAVGKQSI